MKFTLVYTVEYQGKEQFQAENYKNDRHDRAEIETLPEARKWGKDIIDYFNQSLRDHERPRTFYKVLKGHHAKDININQVHPDSI